MTVQRNQIIEVMAIGIATTAPIIPKRFETMNPSSLGMSRLLVARLPVRKRNIQPMHDIHNTSCDHPDLPMSCNLLVDNVTIGGANTAHKICPIPGARPNRSKNRMNHQYSERFVRPWNAPILI